MSSLYHFFVEGGFWMYPIMIAQIASIAIIVERVHALFISRGSDQRGLIKEIESYIRKGELDKAMMRVKSGGAGTALSTTIEAGLQASMNMGGREEIQAKMDEILLVENARLNARNGYLAMLGNVGTLLGLLGTIVGMISCFAAIGSADPVQRAAILAAGISEAMNATAYGLIMAIPTLVAYAVLQSRAQKLFDGMNESALRVYNQLAFYNDNTLATKKVAKK